MAKDFSKKLPAKFVADISSMPHLDGPAWLRRLPAAIQRLEQLWDIRVGDHFPNLSYNFVAHCLLNDGTRAVLKIGLPETDSELFDEAKGLKHLNGNGAVKLLRFDEELEALLIERLMPGDNLKQVFRGAEERSIAPAIELLKVFDRTYADQKLFAGLENRAVEFRKAQDAGFNNSGIETGRKLFEKLCGNPRSEVFLHGDFHHKNILSSNRGKFLTIDVKPMIGCRGYDIAVFLNNHVFWIAQRTNQSKKLIHAIRQFSNEFEIPPEELTDWAFVQQVLAAWWVFEDGGPNWKKDLEFAEIWKSLYN